MLIPRVIWVFGWLFTLGVCQRVLFHGQSMDEPLKGWRRTVHKRVLWIIVPLLLLGYGHTT